MVSISSGSIAMAQETIEGVVEEIIYYNAENGWTVLSLDPHKSRKLGDESITVVGKLLEIAPGESVRFTGTWTTHREYGEQFKADSMHVMTPNSKRQIIKFLANGLIDGITDPVAEKI